MAEQRVYNGYVYTRNSPSEPWTIAGPAQPASGGRQATVVSNPFRQREEQRKDQGQAIEQARLGISQAGEARDARREQAELPYVAPKAAADAAKAEADAQKAQMEAAAAAKEQALAPRPETAKAQSALQTDNVLNLLNTARSQIGEGWSTGNFAGTKGFQGVPLVGQNSTNLSGTLEGIQGNVINDILKQLKAASANGASGYGSLTESEGQRLAAAVASLKQTQDAPTLLNNLAQVERHYRNSLALLNNEDPRDPTVAAKYGIQAAGSAQPPAGGNDGSTPSGPSQLTSQGQFVDDPGLRGANAAVRKMIERGGTPQEIRAYLDSLRPGYGAQVNGIEEAVADWRQNPNSRRQVNIDLEKAWQPASGVSQALGDIGMSPFGSALIGAGDVASLGFLDNLTANPEQTRAVMGGLQEINPGSYLTGQLVGGITGGLGLENLVGRAGMGAARSGLVADALIGSGYGAGSADAPDDSRVIGALIGAGAGAAGNVIGRQAANIAGTGLTGIRDAGRQILNSSGVRMTPGQVLGGAAQRWEDRLAGFPIVGDAINARRREGVQDFNQAAFNEALSPIGGTTGGRIAEPGAQAAHEAVSQAYTDALGGRMVQADPAYVLASQQLAGQVQQIPRVGQDLFSQMRDSIGPMIQNGQITGDSLQDIMQGINTIRGGYRGSALQSPDPLYATHISPALNSYTDILEALVERQEPGAIGALRAANSANRNVSTVDSAVIAAANRNGEFMPSQLMNASKQNSNRFSGKRSTAEGNGPLFDIARAGQEVLPSQVPDSGTAGRLLIPLAAGGAIGGGSYAAQGAETEAAPSSLTTGAVAAALLAAPYSQSARSTVQRSLLSERPQFARDIGEILLENRNIAGLLAAPGAIVYTDR